MSRCLVVDQERDSNCRMRFGTVHVTPPDRLGPYRIEGQLGAGGMGAVFLAFDERLERHVALKKIRTKSDGGAKLRERLRREARAAARLSHPNIVQVYDVVSFDDDWIVMEFVEGERLCNVLESEALALPRVLSLAIDIAKGLAAAHARGIVHRDLKSENVVVTRAGRAKILDFGVAKLGGSQEEATLSKAGRLVGTPHAMSPEQAKGLKVDHRSDLFSLGTLLYSALTGTSPFRSEESFIQTLTRICVHQPEPIQASRPQVPDELSALVDRLLEKDPNHRPQSAEEVVVALQRICGAEKAPIRILFVDDEPAFEQLIRQRYRKMIRAGEIHLDFAVDGHEALRKLGEDEEIALVMSDIKMPGMDGLTLLGEIRKLPRNLLTIVISAFGDMKNIRTAMNHGAFDFLLKPIDFEDLERTRLKAMAAVLKNHERRRLRQENQLLDERNRFIRDAFGRYLSGEDLSPSFAKVLEDPGMPGKKRDVTVVKASLQGFRHLPESLPAAAVHNVLSQLFSAVVGIVLEHGGLLFEFRQGELLVVFGLPIPGENDAQRALDCACALRCATGSISEQSVCRGGPELAVRAGIDTGDVTIGGRQDSRGYEYRISGPAVARASHMESSSGCRQIFVSETTIERGAIEVDAGERVHAFAG